MDPYLVLGVKRSARPAAVKRAFRKRAMATHPDRGGSAEEFQQVRLAYHVLSDPGRRRRYDETGTLDEPKPDNTAAEVAGLLQQTLVAVATGPGAEALVRTDLLGRMKAILAAEQGRLQGGQRSAEKAAKCLDEALSRLTDGGAVLATAVALERDRARHQAEEARRQADLFGKALDYLARCQYRGDPVPASAGWASTTTAAYPFRLG